MRVRRYGELSERGKGTIYVAAWLLHYYGYGYRRIKRILLLLYSVEVSENTLRRWLYEGKKPRFPLSAFERALFYHVAYELALKLKREYPEWGHVRIASELSKLLPIHIPPSTVYFWITGRSRPNVTPVNLKELEAIAYCVGVLVGDYKRTVGGLKNRDRIFVEYYAEMYWRATGTRPNIGTTLDDINETFESGGWLKALWKTGLWKVFAWLKPKWFLKGLYDSEGNPSPKVYHKRRVLTGIVIILTIGNTEVKRIAKLLLERTGFKVQERYDKGEVREIRGKVAPFSGRWRLYIKGWNQAKRFAELIGFRVSYRREMLEDLLKLEPLGQKQRYYWWVQHYEKVNGKWRKKKP